MFSGFEQVLDAITGGRKTTGNCLSIDILAIREANRRFEIFGIGLFRVDQNPADLLIKLKENEIWNIHGRTRKYNSPFVQLNDRLTVQTSTTAAGESVNSIAWYIADNQFCDMCISWQHSHFVSANFQSTAGESAKSSGKVWTDHIWFSRIIIWWLLL